MKRFTFAQNILFGEYWNVVKSIKVDFSIANNTIITQEPPVIRHMHGGMLEKFNKPAVLVSAHGSEICAFQAPEFLEIFRNSTSRYSKQSAYSSVPDSRYCIHQVSFIQT